MLLYHITDLKAEINTSVLFEASNTLESQKNGEKPRKKIWRKLQKEMSRWVYEVEAPSQKLLL